MRNTIKRRILLDVDVDVETEALSYLKQWKNPCQHRGSNQCHLDLPGRDLLLSITFFPVKDFALAENLNLLGGKAKWWRHHSAFCISPIRERAEIVSCSKNTEQKLLNSWPKTSVLVPTWNVMFSFKEDAWWGRIRTHAIMDDLRKKSALSQSTTLTLDIASPCSVEEWQERWRQSCVSHNANDWFGREQVF